MSQNPGASSAAHRQLQAVPSVPETPVERTRRDFSVIDGLTRANRALRLLGSTLFVTFIVGLIGVLALHAANVVAQSELDEQRAEISDMRDRNERLAHELALLEAPARIVGEAKAMGMIEAPSIVYLQASSGELGDRVLRVAENQLRAMR